MEHQLFRERCAVLWQYDPTSDVGRCPINQPLGGEKGEGILGRGRMGLEATDVYSGLQRMGRETAGDTRVRVFV